MGKYDRICMRIEQIKYKGSIIAVLFVLFKPIPETTDSKKPEHRKVSISLRGDVQKKVEY